MKRKFSRVLTLILLLSLVISNVSLAQIMFTDVDENHWAKEYVEDVVKQGFMYGYNDGTFRPGGNVNKIQALTMVSKLMDYTKEDLDVARNKYDNFVKQFPLSEGEKDILSFALYKEIVYEDLVTNTYFKDGKATDAEKLEVCVYLVRAMGLEEEARKGGGVLLFKDAEWIPDKACPYLHILIQKKILDSKGDSEGKFNPFQPITRGAMAKMLSLANADMDKNPQKELPVVEPKPVQPPVEDTEVQPLPIELNVKPEGNEILGNIVAKAGDFVIIESIDKKDSYKIVSNTSITVNGNTSTKESLEKGMTVKITVKEGNILSSIESESTNDILSGKILGVNLGANPSIKLESDDNTVKTVYLAEDTKVLVNGKSSLLFTLRENDTVKVEVINNLGIKIVVESLNGSLKGTIVEKNIEDDYLLVVEREDGSEHEYTLDKNVNIMRNGSQANFEQLRRKDVVNINLANGLVTDVDAMSVKGEDEGYIKGILISDEPQLIIGMENGKEETYDIMKSAFIKVDGKIVDIYGLRLGQYANVKLESDEIVELKIVTKKGK
ncbi:S-layer homology domain-containing protein [Anaerosalibacter sp. Marseille-P3206]|uniref:S-layer homology domain-containing protein n=1 Tax=Anaerosalibacter sp. Marseille-P3206 TaxID=1871005 RepID=UPI0009841D75|nr:S-layer homology domain-containing protein [Anaerosalibacter sp. Marseille-P3206]